MAAFAVTGTPPFSIFQSEFTALSGAVDNNHPWAAALFIAGIVTIFVGFLLHMANMNLGAAPGLHSRGTECPWKLAAMLLVAGVVVVFGVWLPRPIYSLVGDSARLLSGSL